MKWHRRLRRGLQRRMLPEWITELLLVVVLLAALAAAIWITGCAAESQRIGGPGIALQDVRIERMDRWSERIDEMTELVDALRRHWPWIIVGLPVMTYLVPKLLWRLVGGLLAGSRGKR